MFTVRDSSLYQPSQKAQEAFRRQQIFNRIITALMIFMGILTVWNFITIASILRSGAVDLADTRSILSHISSRLLFISAAITFVLVVIKEWKWGDPGFATSFILAPILFFALVPVMSAELQPAEEEMRLSASFTVCEPGGLEALAERDTSLCESVHAEEGRVLMSATNPADSDGELLEPDNVETDRASWDVEARGEFTVYFLLQQESREACENSTFAQSAEQSPTDTFDCVDVDGVAYSSHPFVTSNTAGKWFSMIQEVAP